MEKAVGVGKVKKLEQKILGEEKKIENMEEAVKKEEERIEKEELKLIKLDMKILSKVGFLQTFISRFNKYSAKTARVIFLKKLSRKKLLSSAIVLIAVVLAWRGIWVLADATPVISHPLVSIAVGFFVLWAINRYSTLLD